jgi:hypothetical protein
MFDYAPRRDGTPCGAFSYDGSMYVFGGINGPTGLSMTREPRKAAPLRWLFTLSNWRETHLGNGAFMQVAPCLIKNSLLDVPHPRAGAGDGVLMFGQGGRPVILGLPQTTQGVSVAWMPIRPGRRPRLSDVRYYTGRSATGKPEWSPEQAKARQLFPTHFHWSSLSAGYVPSASLWIVLYQRTGDWQAPGGLDETILARVAATPWDIETAQEIVIFDPIREQARGRYMEPAWRPHHHPPAAYGAYILNHYTRWDPVLSKLAINYLLSTGDPYQVQIMETVIKIDG